MTFSFDDYLPFMVWRIILGGRGGMFGESISYEYLESENMHLFETKDGDIWVCSFCAKESAEEKVNSGEWEWIFDKEEPTLRCSICKGPDFEFDD